MKRARYRFVILEGLAAPSPHRRRHLDADCGEFPARTRPIPRRLAPQLALRAIQSKSIDYYALELLACRRNRHDLACILASSIVKDQTRAIARRVSES